MAQAELDSVGGTYVSWFAPLGNPAKGRAWANRFYGEYRGRIEGPRSNPWRFPACTVYPFDAVDTEYRSFVVGWFTVFYTVEGEAGTFTVWHVRSSRSDFSKMRPR